MYVLHLNFIPASNVFNPGVAGFRYLSWNFKLHIRPPILIPSALYAGTRIIPPHAVQQSSPTPQQAQLGFGHAPFHQQASEDPVFDSQQQQTTTSPTFVNGRRH